MTTLDGTKEVFAIVREARKEAFKVAAVAAQSIASEYGEPAIGAAIARRIEAME